MHKILKRSITATLSPSSNSKNKNTIVIKSSNRGGSGITVNSSNLFGIYALPAEISKLIMYFACVANARLLYVNADARHMAFEYLRAAIALRKVCKAWQRQLDKSGFHPAKALSELDVPIAAVVHRHAIVASQSTLAYEDTQTREFLSGSFTAMPVWQVAADAPSGEANLARAVYLRTAIVNWCCWARQYFETPTTAWEGTAGNRFVPMYDCYESVKLALPAYQYACNVAGWRTMLDNGKKQPAFFPVRVPLTPNHVHATVYLRSFEWKNQPKPKFVYRELARQKPAEALFAFSYRENGPAMLAKVLLEKPHSMPMLYLSLLPPHVIVVDDLLLKMRLVHCSTGYTTVVDLPKIECAENARLPQNTQDLGAMFDDLLFGQGESVHRMMHTI